MAGLYIHVPFCAKRCLYCDFYSNTDMRFKEPYLRALLEEMRLRAPYLNGERIESIYLGGGTPSQLEPEELQKIFEAAFGLFEVDPAAEITLEANPDDLSPSYLQGLRQLPINRISMGVQSFHDDDLRFLNRRHDRQQAIRAVRECQDAGLSNLSIDLIYGLPRQTEERWESNLTEALALDVPHLSAYHLIYEEGTALYRLKEAGQLSPVSEELSLRLFTRLIDRLTEGGYVHYEISNFARPGFLARHNSSYWTGKSYLGLGPSAHSYNGTERSWNVASLPLYLQAIQDGKPAIESEDLDLYTRYNDYIITRLRTCWGLSLTELESMFGDRLLRYCQRQAGRHIRQGNLEESDGILRLSRSGIFISDGIMSDLLWV